ncbi:MAG: DUF1049 domain-containing protein [Synechococcales cyanobacterium RM1_1_8]|nr:DUF1049 domain-containing protein [Synechococcales cyanobacterium RM1_1_8]
MRTTLPLLTIATFGLGLGAIALFAQQNAQLVTLSLFGFPLLSLPLGLVLTFALLAGLLLAMLCHRWVM